MTRRKNIDGEDAAIEALLKGEAPAPEETDAERNQRLLAQVGYGQQDDEDQDGFEYEDGDEDEEEPVNGKPVLQVHHLGRVPCYEGEDDEYEDGHDGEIELMPGAEGCQAPQPEPVRIEFDLKPKEMKELLDKDVIGQEKAKKYLSNAICYHYARIKREQGNGHDHDTVIKKNVLLIGNTGVGKTYIVKKLAKNVGVPFAKKDATKFSATGYVGDDVENMILDLYAAADRNIELTQYGIVFVDEIDKIRGGATFGKDVGGAEVQRGLLKLMEETDVDVPVSTNPLAAMIATQEGQANENTRPPKINTKNILFIMSGAFPGLEHIVSHRTGEEYDENSWRDDVTTEDLVNYGMEAEFIGRLPVRVGLRNLTTDDLYKILKVSGDSVIQQYIADFKSYDIDAVFTDEALYAFAEKAAELGTGARALTSVIEEVMTDFLYELPSTDIRKLEITKELVEDPRGTFIDLTLDSAIQRAAGRFHKETGTYANFDDTGRAALKQQVLESDDDPEQFCTELFRRYRDAMKLYRQEEFVLDKTAVEEPNKYFARLFGDAPR
ncbi:TPA: AAA domain-containing protein [Candidatus Woesearchaeota archaeon]|nr:AAA domain-containing protein [Candidatus Woesearchaeota archaeon]